MSSSRRIDAAVCFFLTAAVIVVFWPVRHYDFVNFDDKPYVVENPLVQDGVTLRGIGEAFTTFCCANWHPLTWLSLMLDSQLFGMNPAAFHLTNVALHAGCTVLLYLALVNMTSRRGAAAFVAGLFALHPLHVESVAWIAERKDVLSTLFWMLVLWSYGHYARGKDRAWYSAVIAFFVLGLLSKPMLVTLPCVLLLLDYWPLNRQERWRELIREKLPLIAIAAAACVITIVAQRQGGAIRSLELITWTDRIANAAAAYGGYLQKMVFPVQLAVFYPYAMNRISPMALTFVVVLLTGISVASLKLVRRCPAVLVGWLWFLGTLVPVIGLVQVGGQSMADRYTYIPLIGLFVVVAYAVPVPKSLRTLLCQGCTAVAVLAMCAVATHAQLAHWQNSITLFEHALAVTEKNHLAHESLAFALCEVNRHDEAIPHFLATLEIKPQHTMAHNNVALLYTMREDFDSAAFHYREALRLDPHQPRTCFELGKVLAATGNTNAAEVQFAAALALDPNYAAAHCRLANLLAHQDRFEEALNHCQTALRISPRSKFAQSTLDDILRRKDEYLPRY